MTTRLRNVPACKYCGGKRIIITTSEDGDIAAMCSACYATGPNERDHRDARKAWVTGKAIWAKKYNSTGGNKPCKG